MESILVVEDDLALRSVLCAVLESQGYQVKPTASAEEALSQLGGSQKWSCVLSDFRLPGRHGLDLVRDIRRIQPDLPVVVMTAFGSIALAVEAMKEGANDFITKPFEPDALARMLQQVIDHRRIIDRVGSGDRSKTRTIVSHSPVMAKLLAQARLVAAVDSPVLILGESGTGKELLARAIHEGSPRRGSPFVAINCAAMPADLLESEFFGHEAGAFTGATQARPGILEVASGGTVFLDEVGDMAPQLQVKLLRALQEREIRRVGGTKNISINPRVIAATNRNVGPRTDHSSLREDLYYRLAVITFTLPPLRERPEDILLIADHYVQYYANALGKELTLSSDAREFLEHYSWPGNARELENVIERAAILSAKEISPRHLGIEPSLDLAAIEQASKTLSEIGLEAARNAEREVIQRTLRRTKGNKSRASQILGVSYKTLLSKVKDYGLDHAADEESAAPSPG